MPGRLPDSVVHRIVVRLSVGEDPVAIAQVVGVSRASVYRIQLNIDLFNAPYPPTTVVLGRPRAMLPYHEEASSAYVIIVMRSKTNV
jgi:hypothetical protein